MNNRRIILKDLFFVIFYTAVLSILFGIILAFIDYYLQIAIHFTFANLLFLMIAIYIGKTIRGVVKSPHIIYSIIAGIGMFVSWLIIVTLPSLYAFGLSLQTPLIILNIRYYFNTAIDLFNPLSFISNFSFDYLISMLILGVGCYLGISRTIR